MPRGSAKRKRPSPAAGRGKADADVKLMNLLKDKRQLGAILTGIGLLLTFMGMMLFFEGNLLRLGNVSSINSCQTGCEHSYLATTTFTLISYAD